MLKDTRSQKQKFMDELGHQLQRRKLDTQQMNDGLLHVKWNEQKLCTVDSSGAVRFRAGDILDAEAEHQLQSVMHMAKQVKEYMSLCQFARTHIESVSLQRSDPKFLPKIELSQIHSVDSR